MGRALVTQEQWKRVIRRNPTPWDLENNYRPVVNVTWEETEEFFRRLETMDSYHRYRLPTEAEWERACRAGQDGDSLVVDEQAKQAARFGLAPAAPKKPNPWGFFDMDGTNAEWCRDWYEPYTTGPDTVDPVGPPSGYAKIFRGGAFATNADGLRPAARAWYSVTTHTIYIGFRVVRIPKEQAPS
jgi:formylglycine-generating enzyme required for sulfatase activity